MQRIPSLVIVMLTSTMWYTSRSSRCAYIHVKVRIVPVPVLGSCVGWPLLLVVKIPDNVVEPQVHTHTYSHPHSIAITIQGLVDLIGHVCQSFIYFFISGTAWMMLRHPGPPRVMLAVKVFFS